MSNKYLQLLLNQRYKLSWFKHIGRQGFHKNCINLLLKYKSHPLYFVSRLLLQNRLIYSDLKSEFHCHIKNLYIIWVLLMIFLFPMYLGNNITRFIFLTDSVDLWHIRHYKTSFWPVHHRYYRPCQGGRSSRSHSMENHCYWSSTLQENDNALEWSAGLFAIFSIKSIIVPLGSYKYFCSDVRQCNVLVIAW